MIIDISDVFDKRLVWYSAIMTALSMVHPSPMVVWAVFSLVAGVTLGTDIAKIFET